MKVKKVLLGDFDPLTWKETPKVTISKSVSKEGQEGVKKRKRRKLLQESVDTEGKSCEGGSETVNAKSSVAKWIKL